MSAASPGPRPRISSSCRSARASSSRAVILANCVTARCASAAAASTRPACDSTDASSRRARAASSVAPLRWNRSSASSCWRRAPSRSPAAAATSPRHSPAVARSGSVPAASAMSASSSTAAPASFVRPAPSLRPHQNLECPHPFGPVVRMHAAQIALGQIASRYRVAAVERQGRPSDRRHRVPLGPIEERVRFVEASLQAPQFAEARGALGRHPGPDSRQFLHGSLEFALGLVPLAVPHADGGVLRPAHREQRPKSPSGAEGLDARAPLRGAVVVAHAVAGGDQIAARQADGHAVRHVAGDDGRAHAVQTAHALGHLSGADLCDAFHGLPEQLEVPRACGPRGFDGFRCVVAGAVGVAFFEQLEHALAHRQPGVLRACRAWTRAAGVPAPASPATRRLHRGRRA